MITSDGSRSRKRKWFAEKQLRIIKDIDVPSKALKWDGFTFRVWQQDDLSGGRITAPMGAVVSCSTETGAKLAVAENWSGAFVLNNDLHVIYYEVEPAVKSQKVFNGASEEDVILDGNQILQWRPAVFQSPYYVDGAETWLRDFSTTIGLTPYFGGEAYWTTITSQAFIDFNENGTADHPKYIAETELNFYAGDGSALGGRKGIDLQTEQNINEAWRFFQHYPSGRLSLFHTYWPDIVDGRIVVTRDYDFPNVSYTMADELIEDGSVPAELRSLLLQTAVVAGPTGTYCFELGGVRTTLYAVDATETGVYWGGSQHPELRDYFRAHPEDEHYKLFYCFKEGENAHVISSQQFLSVLNDLADVDVTANWNDALRMMQQLTFTPPANHNYDVPHDTWTFFSHEGYVYTWTRKYGAVYFTSTGIYQAVLNIPAEVANEDGVQPQISYAGTYYEGTLAEEHRYVCICHKKEKIIDPEEINIEVKGVYAGSPFDTWTALPMPQPPLNTEYKIVYVRPAQSTPESTTLIGVVKQINEDLTKEYRFASFVDGKWNIMGQLPFDVGASDNITAALYGNGGMVDELTRYPTQPVTQPQMPIGPYDSYAEAGMP